MCGPAVVPIAGLVISAASAVYGMVQSNKQADAQAQAAEMAMLADKEQLGLEAEQIQDKTTLEKMERERQAQREQSRIIVSASESGGLGGSFLSQLANARLQNSYDQGIIDKNRTNMLKQNQAGVKGVAAQYQSRLNEAESRRVSPFMAGLQITGAGLDAYGQYKDSKIK